MQSIFYFIFFFSLLDFFALYADECRIVKMDGNDLENKRKKKWNQKREENNIEPTFKRRFIHISISNWVRIPRESKRAVKFPLMESNGGHYDSKPSAIATGPVTNLIKFPSYRFYLVQHVSFSASFNQLRLEKGTLKAPTTQKKRNYIEKYVEEEQDIEHFFLHHLLRIHAV